MKTFIYSYNRDTLDDDVAYKNIRKLSKDQLSIDMQKVKAGNLFEPIRKERKPERRDTREGSNNRNKNRTPNNKNSYKKRR